VSVTIAARVSPGHDHEADRVAALRSYGILDTPPDAALDDLVRLAAVILAAPVAVVNLVDAKRTWAKAAIGVPQGSEAAREEAFCADAIASPSEILVIPNTLEAERYADCRFTRAGLRVCVDIRPILHASS
jgi:hypothetical protein